MLASLIGKIAECDALGSGTFGQNAYPILINIFGIFAFYFISCVLLYGIFLVVK
jgi:hypothetical protein